MREFDSMCFHSLKKYAISFRIRLAYTNEDISESPVIFVQYISSRNLLMWPWTRNILSIESSIVNGYNGLRSWLFRDETKLENNAKFFKFLSQHIGFDSCLIKAKCLFSKEMIPVISPNGLNNFRIESSVASAVSLIRLPQKTVQLVRNVSFITFSYFFKSKGATVKAKIVILTNLNWTFTINCV